MYICMYGVENNSYIVLLLVYHDVMSISTSIQLSMITLVMMMIKPFDCHKMENVSRSTEERKR